MGNPTAPLHTPPPLDDPPVALLRQRDRARTLADELERLIEAGSLDLNPVEQLLLEEAVCAACRCLDHLNRIASPDTAPPPMPGPKPIAEIHWLYYPATLHLAAWISPESEPPPGAWTVSATWLPRVADDTLNLKLSYGQDWRELDIYTDYYVPWAVGAMRDAVRCTMLDPLIRSLLADLLKRACRHDPDLPPIGLHAEPALVAAES